MASATAKCQKCQKTVYPTERVDAGGSVWHKLCFRCCDTKCSITLNLTNFKAHEGLVYCARDVPKPRHTPVADDVATRSALSTPKKVAEGLGFAQKGTGETPHLVRPCHPDMRGIARTLISDGGAVDIKHALNAPKRKAEGLDKVSRIE